MQFDIDVNPVCDECGEALGYNSGSWNNDLMIKPCPVCARSMWKNFSEEKPEKSGYYVVTNYYGEEDTGIAKYANGAWTILDDKNIVPELPSFKWTEAYTLVK